RASCYAALPSAPPGGQVGAGGATFFIKLSYLSSTIALHESWRKFLFLLIRRERRSSQSARPPQPSAARPNRKANHAAARHSSADYADSTDFRRRYASV